MRSALRLRSACYSFVSLLVVSGFACSGPAPSDETPTAGTGTGGHAGTAPTTAGTLSGGGSAAAGTASAGSSTTLGGGAGSGTAGSASEAGRGGHSTAGVAGMSAGGAHAGATTGGNAGSSSGGSGGSGGTSSAAVCDKVKTEYASELAKQLECKPGAGSQCTNRAAAAPGCECRVFIQPADPFAIEHLSNLANGWFDADCSMPSCPAKCSTAAAGTCQADAKSSLGGRCVSP